MINCWEPATKEANHVLGPGTVIYAFTEEGYYKWGHGAYVHVKALERGNIDNIYKVLNYFLGGEYRAYQAKRARLRRPEHGPRRQVRRRQRLVEGRHRESQVDRRRRSPASSRSRSSASRPRPTPTSWRRSGSAS